MRGTEWIKIAVKDGQSQKRYTRATLMFLMLSLVVFVGVNCIVGSVKDSVESLLEKPRGRVLCFVDTAEKVDMLYEYLRNDYTGQDALGDVFYSSPDVTMYWQDSREYVQDSGVVISGYSFFDTMLEYHCDGECRKPQEGEVVLPKYLYDTGIYNNVNYYDTESLVGKEITISMDGAQGTREETLTVIGTYDNIQSQMFSTFLFNDGQIKNWYLENNVLTESDIEFQREYMDEEQRAYVEQCIEEEYHGDESAFWQDYIGAQPYVCVYVNPGYDMDEFADEILEEMDMLGIRETTLDDSLVLYLDFLILAGNLVSGLLLMTTLVNIMLMTSTEVNRREKEFALRRAQGFLQRDISLIMVIEKLFSFGLATAGAIAIVGVLICCGNYVIDQLFPFYLRYVTLAYDRKVLAVAVLCAFTGVASGMIVVLPKLWRTDIVKTLKKE